MEIHIHVWKYTYMYGNTYLCMYGDTYRYTLRTNIHLYGDTHTHMYRTHTWLHTRMYIHTQAHTYWHTCTHILCAHKHERQCICARTRMCVCVCERERERESARQIVRYRSQRLQCPATDTVSSVLLLKGYVAWLFKCIKHAGCWCGTNPECPASCHLWSQIKCSLMWQKKNTLHPFAQNSRFPCNTTLKTDCSLFNTHVSMCLWGYTFGGVCVPCCMPGESYHRCFRF